MKKSHYGAGLVQKRGPELAKKKAEIFLITAMQIDEDVDRPFALRTIGYFFDLKDAIDGLLSQSAIDTPVTHAVIEVIPPGVTPAASKEHWFARNGTAWRSCEKPAQTARTSNYAIG